MGKAKFPTPDRSRLGRSRDYVAWLVCQFMLKHVATEWYRRMIEGLILHGRAASARESKTPDA